MRHVAQGATYSSAREIRPHLRGEALHTEFQQCTYPDRRTKHLQDGCIELQHGAQCCNALFLFAAWCTVLQRIIPVCSMMHCVADTRAQLPLGVAHVGFHASSARMAAMCRAVPCLIVQNLDGLLIRLQCGERIPLLLVHNTCAARSSFVPTVPLRQHRDTTARCARTEQQLQLEMRERWHELLLVDALADAKRMAKRACCNTGRHIACCNRCNCGA